MRRLSVAWVLLLGAFLRLFRLAELPPSTGFDPAYYGVDALGILSGELPVYLASNYGREALFSYFVAGMFAGIGVSDFAIHLTAAFCGIITLAATYAVAKELLNDHPN